MTARYAFIDAEKAQYSIVKMCAWMGVSTSGFYEWRDRPPSATAQRRARLATLIEWIFNDSDHTYGHRRVHAALARQGERVTPELVRAIMRELGLVPCQPRPFRPTTTTIGGGPGPIPIWWRGTSTPTLRARSSSGTSPICRPGRAGCTSPR